MKIPHLLGEDRELGLRVVCGGADWDGEAPGRTFRLVLDVEIVGRDGRAIEGRHFDVVGRPGAWQVRGGGHTFPYRKLAEVATLRDAVTWLLRNTRVALLVD